MGNFWKLFVSNFAREHSLVCKGKNHYMTNPLFDYFGISQTSKIVALCNVSKQQNPNQLNRRLVVLDYYFIFQRNCALSGFAFNQWLLQGKIRLILHCLKYEVYSWLLLTFHFITMWFETQRTTAFEHNYKLNSSHFSLEKASNNIYKV